MRGKYRKGSGRNINLATLRRNRKRRDFRRFMATTMMFAASEVLGFELQHIQEEIWGDRS